MADAYSRVIDDIAPTFLDRFCQQQNLRAMFTSPLLSDLPDVANAFNRVFASDTRGTLLDDIATFEGGSTKPPTAESNDYFRLPDDLAEKLRQQVLPVFSKKVFNPFITKLDSVSEGGDIYKPVGTRSGDENAVFKTTKDKTWRAGRILMFFNHAHMGLGNQRTEATFVVLEEYKPLSPMHRESDPYRHYSVAGGRLFYDEFLPKQVLLLTEVLHCHCSISRPRIHWRDNAINDKVVHILPLNKVGHFTLFSPKQSD